MWLTVIGLAVATLSAVVSAITGQGSKRRKRVLAGLALLGFAAALYSTIETDRTSKAKVSSGPEARVARLPAADCAVGRTGVA